MSAVCVSVAVIVGAAPAASAATAPGTVMAWGDNTYGQLGNGTTTASRAPQAVPNLTGVTDLAGGRDNEVALLSNGTVRAWGINNYGQVGDGTKINRSEPTTVRNLSGVAAVATGHYHDLALLSNGTVRAWGLNGAGQLGDGTRTNRLTPMTVQSAAGVALSGVAQIAGGRAHSIAVKTDGSVWTWGDNANGQLGDGTTTARTRPVQVALPLPAGVRVVDVAGGRDTTLAVASDGSVWGWGRNDFGQVGDGTTIQRTRPVRVQGLTGVVGKAVEAGAFHSALLTSGGAVYTWGRGNLGQLGLGATALARTPQKVNFGNSTPLIKTVVCGRDHTLAGTDAGALWAWGNNDLGQLGDGTTTVRRTPTAVQLRGSAAIGGAGRSYSAVLIPSP